MTILYKILINITLVFTFYFALTGLWAFKKSKVIPKFKKKNKLAILIAY